MRTTIGRLRLVTAAVAMVLLGSTVPAGAQTITNLACIAAQDAGFTDVSPVSVHKADIDCIKFWGITQQTGAYGPSEPVSRWQMALFLTRTFLVDGGPLPDGTGQVFNDIGSLPVDTQLTINQLKRMGITSGVAPGSYDPHSPVPRWQMALFLTRLLLASGVALPDGTNQGFVDIGGLSAEAQIAINQARQLGIAAGTSGTTFTPDAPVTREQMASFLARALNAILRFPTIELAPLLTCNPPFVQDLPGTVCTGTISWFGGFTFTVREAWFFVGPLIGPGFPPPTMNTGFQLFVDGSPVTTTETLVVMEGIAFQYFTATFPGGLTGTHIIEARWIDGGATDLTVTVTVNFS